MNIKYHASLKQIEGLSLGSFHDQILVWI